MTATAILEWKFLPSDFFPEPLEFSGQDYTMAIENGEARAEIDAAVYDAKPDETRERLHRNLNNRFRVAQLKNHRRYEFLCSMVIIHPNSRRYTILEI